MAKAVINGVTYLLKETLEVKNKMVIIDGYSTGEIDSLKVILNNNGVDDKSI